MANQYRTALHEVTDEFSVDLERHNIRVDPGERMIVWRDLVINIRSGTDKRECRRKFKKLIQAAKETERKETQVSLL